jgi:integrase
MARPTNSIRAQDRGDGLYRVRFREHTRWFSTPCDDRESALAWARRNRDRLLSESFPGEGHQEEPVPAVTFGAFSRKFYDDGSPWAKLQSSLRRALSSEYLPQMRGRLENYLLPAFNDRPIDSISGLEFLEWLADLQGRAGRSTGRKGKPISNSSKNKILDCAKNIFAYAKLKRTISEDPLQDIHHLVRAEESRQPFTAEEISRLFPVDRTEAERIWQTQMWLAYFLTLRDTGARPSEIHALRWEDWDQETSGFPIVNAVQNSTGEIKNRTKTGSVKPAYLSTRTAQELRIWKHFCPQAAGRDLVFSMDGVKPLRTESAAKHFRGACIRAQVERKDRTPYCLRHTFATIMLEELPLAMVQQLLGHSIGSSVTKRSYYRPSKRSIMQSGRKAKEAMDEVRGEE